MDVEVIIGLIAIAFGLVDIVAIAYIWNIYRQRHEDAPFLTHYFRRDLRVAAASGVIAALIANSYLNASLPRPWGAVVLGACLIVLMSGPIADALLWRRERRKD